MALTPTEESQIRSLLVRNIDMKKRRVVNAGDAIDAGDYITKRQFDGFTTTKSGLLIPSHGSTHETVGSDEINVGGLKGLLADPQTPLAHAISHELGGSDVIAIDTLGAATDITALNVTSTSHGMAPKSPADATKFLNGAATPDYALVKDSDITFTDITTNNVSTTKHGWQPKLPNDATKYLDGTGAYSVPPATGTVWNQTINEAGTSLANWTQTSGSWSVVSSAFQVNTGATTIRNLAYTTKIAQSAIVYECQMSMGSTGGFAADNRMGLCFNWNGSGTPNSGVLVTFQSTGALTPASTGVILTQQPMAVNNGLTITKLFNLDTFYTLRVVAIGNVMDIYINSVYITTRRREPFPITANPGAEHSSVGLYAYNCIANFKDIKMYSIQLP